jgi:hypothetical protein
MPYENDTNLPVTYTRYSGGSRNAYELTNNGTMYPNAALNLAGTLAGFPTSRYYATGISFQLPVERYRTINSAYLQIAPIFLGATPELRIYIEATDDAAEFTSTTSDITDRTWTDTTEEFTGLVAGTMATSPDLASYIQAIVNRSGWEKDNYIAFRLLYLGAGIEYAQLAATTSLNILTITLAEWPPWDSVSDTTASAWDPTAVGASKWDSVSDTTASAWDHTAVGTAKWDFDSTVLQLSAWDETTLGQISGWDIHGCMDTGFGREVFGRAISTNPPWNGLGFGHGVHCKTWCSPHDPISDTTASAWDPDSTVLQISAWDETAVGDAVWDPTSVVTTTWDD